MIMKTTIGEGLVAQHGNDWTQDKEEKQTTQKIRKTKYKCKKYLLRSKYMTPSNGVKVDDNIPLTFSSSQFEEKNEKKYKYKYKYNEYKCKRYLLRSKYMTPSNGVKVDGHIPSSTNARQLLSCLLLRIGKVI